MFFPQTIYPYRIHILIESISLYNPQESAATVSTTIPRYDNFLQLTYFFPRDHKKASEIETLVQAVL